jgi:hypothetical protein
VERGAPPNTNDTSTAGNNPHPRNATPIIFTPTPGDDDTTTPHPAG